MRGSIRKRYKDSWSIILHLGYQLDPVTGKPKRNQKWYTVQGTKRDAEKKLAELLHQANRHELVEPTKMTLGTWLDEWLETAIKPPNKRLRSYETYRSVMRKHLKPAWDISACNSSCPLIYSATITIPLLPQRRWNSTTLSCIAL